MSDEMDGSGGRADGSSAVSAQAIYRETIRSDEPYRALVELTSDAVYCFEFAPPINTSLGVNEQIDALHAGVLADCNEACARVYGADRPEDIIGRRLEDLFPVGNPTMDAVLRSFVENGYRTIDAQSVGTSRDGTTRYYTNSAQGFLSGGRLRRMWGTWREITASKSAEALIRQSELRLNEAQRLAKIGSWEVDPAKDSFIWSHEVYRIFEVDPESFVPCYESFISLVHRDDRAQVEATINNSLRTGEPYTLEHRLMLADGSIKHVSERCEISLDETGRVRRAIGTIQDITEAKQSEATIEELMAKLEALASVAFDGIAISENGILRECSAQFASALGYTTEEIRDQPILDFVAPAFRLTAKTKLSGETVRPFELRMLRKDGSTLPVEIVRATITVGERRLRVYGLRDITHRKELQSEVIAISEDERHRIGRDLHDGLGQLLFGASLSLRSVCDQLEEAGSSLLPAVQQIKDIVVDAIDETRRVSHLLVPTVYERNNLSMSLKQLVATVNAVSDVDFRAECSYERPLPASATAEQLYRITQECISNALKHSNASEVVVRLYAEDGLLHLEVTDDGIGMARGEPSQSAGLGVRSMHYRAGLIDGSLEIMPAELGGTRILCTCPI